MNDVQAIAPSWTSSLNRERTDTRIKRHFPCNIEKYLARSSNWLRTPPFHGGETGSNPVRATTIAQNWGLRTMEWRPPEANMVVLTVVTYRKRCTKTLTIAQNWGLRTVDEGKLSGHGGLLRLARAVEYLALLSSLKQD